MRKSKFNLTHLHSTTLDMGYLVPICLLDCLPNDSFRISLSSFIRAQPMLSPLMHEVFLYTQYWFVPYRLLWDNWEAFITGGNDGLETPPFPIVKAPDGGFQTGSLADYFGFPVNQASIEVSAMPFRAMAEIWNTRYRDEDLQDELPVSYADGLDEETNVSLLSPAWKKDYFTTARNSTQRGAEISVPVNVSNDFSQAYQVFTGKLNWYANNAGSYDVKGVTAKPSWCKLSGWISPIGTLCGVPPNNNGYHSGVVVGYNFNGSLTDYFNDAIFHGKLQEQLFRDVETELETALLPIVPKPNEAVPVTKNLPDNIASPDVATLSGLKRSYNVSMIVEIFDDSQDNAKPAKKVAVGFTAVASINKGTITFSTRRAETGLIARPDISYSGVNGQWGIADYHIDFTLKNPTGGSGSIGNVDIRDLRVASALQRYQERSLKYGNRYEEFIQREFGIKPRDSRIQRPEYLGGSKSVLQISEVLQTAEGADSGVGTMRGHGVAGMRQRPIRFTCPEHGLILGLLSIRPAPVYTQGIDRAWLKRTKLDFFVPELANIGMQEVFQQELFATKDNKNMIFGYQDRYNEYRSMRPRVTGEFRTTQLSYWNIARHFEQPPFLNGSFINMANSANTFKRPFAVQNQHAFLAMIRNNIRAFRPIPKVAKNILK